MILNRKIQVRPNPQINDIRYKKSFAWLPKKIQLASGQIAIVWLESYVTYQNYVFGEWDAPLDIRRGTTFHFDYYPMWRTVCCFLIRDGRII